nr:MAG TPA: hypothetical protein [Caudoviricetes sp.]
MAAYVYAAINHPCKSPAFQRGHFHFLAIYL